jgi:excisionase family DNA binding protein
MTETSEWVSLRKAAEMLGVHPATVRNWADTGKLASRRTAGGHRRFHTGDIAQFAQSQGDIQPVEVQIIIQNALGQARMQVGDGRLDSLAWYAKMSDGTRQSMRTYGRELLEELRRYMGSDASDSALSRAISIGKRYAEILSADGLTLPEAMRGYFYFGDFVINSILTWSEITPPRSAPEWASMVREVNTFMSAMQLSIIEYYQDAEDEE